MRYSFIKTLLSLSLAGCLVLTLAGCASIRGSYRDFYLEWERLGAFDDSKAFKKCDKQHQQNDISDIISRAFEEYSKCTTIEDLEALNVKVTAIKSYLDISKKPSIVNTANLHKLNRMIMPLNAPPFKNIGIVESE